MDVSAGRRARFQRRWAVLWLAIAVGALVAGIAIYAWKAPTVGIVGHELGGSGQKWPLPHGTHSAVRWDFVLLAGCGVALFVSLLLARAVFWSARARDVARLGLALAATAVVADVVENVILLNAHHAHTGWLDLATGAAVVKFSSLGPAAAIAIAGFVTTATRLVRNHPKALEDRKEIGVVPPLPVTVNDAVASKPAKTIAADRWRRGYHLAGEAFYKDEDEDEAKEDRDKGEPEAPVGGVGICLSGGGVRSASVALGAMQSLRSELLRAQHLVSVSGGGYTAGALQLALTNAGDDRQYARSDPAKPDNVIHDPKEAFAPGSVEEDWIRRHADYLISKPTELVSALGVVARGLLLSLLVLFGPALVLGVVIGRAWKRVPLAPYVPSTLTPWSDHLTYPSVRTGTWYGVGALVAIGVVAYVFTLIVPGRFTACVRGVAKMIAAVTLIVAVISLGVPSLVYVSALVLQHSSSTRLPASGAVVTLLLTYGTVIVSIGRNKTVKSAASGLFGRGGTTVGAVPSGALQLVFVIVTLVVLATGWLLLLGGMAAIASANDAQVVAVAVFVAVGILGVFVDQTWLSLHPFYRRQLAGAFATRRVRVNDAVVAEGYDFSEKTTLSTYAARPEGFPAVVFAGTANLSGEKLAPLNAVPYVFSGEWVGGPDLGYMNTKELCEAVSTRLGRDLTVEAAVAISGAAFASSMGRAGRWYSTLFAVTGLRLGTWLPNPRFVRERNVAMKADDWRVPDLPRLRRLSSLLREVFRVHPEEGRLLHITDGGHYENLGLVELLRRRCTEIYCIDASGDSPPTAGTLEEAITLAYEELGVRIKLDGTMWDTTPGTGTPYDPAEVFASLNQRISKRAVVRATIVYPEESGLPRERREGMLIFVKTLLTREMPYDILSYAARNGVFPRDSTGDQFFDDGKFCGYRALGAELGVLATREWRPQVHWGVPSNGSSSDDHESAGIPL